MSKKSLIVYSALITLGCGSLTFTQSASAANMFNMMNPSKWFGSDRGRYYDDYYYDRYRYGGPYGYGPGWGGYGPYGYGPGWGGYGPGWGGPGWGGYGYGQQQKSDPPPPPLPQ